MKSRGLSNAAAALCTLYSASSAQAQVQKTLVDSPIPFTYSRGRNVAVTERDRPEIRAVGINAGGFSVYPQITLGLGYSDNIFRSATDETDDGYVRVAPILSAVSHWSRHALRLSTGGSFDRYNRRAVRNEDNWNAAVTGRLDVGTDSSVNLDVQTAGLTESIFSGSVLANVASPLSYQRTYASVRGNYVGGRTRLVGAFDFTDFSFKSIQTQTGTVLNQASRNRQITRGTGQVEYAISPDTALFIQAGFTQTDYSSLLGDGSENRSSTGLRALSGVTFDVSALVRGSVGVGYVRRDYRASRYHDMEGLSFEGMVEYFPSELTTVALTARRLIEDSTAAGSSGYYNTGGSVRVDHELLRNLLLRATADYEVDKFRGAASHVKIFQTSGGVRYYANRNLVVNGDLSYGDRTVTGTPIGPVFDEIRGMLSLTVQM